VQEYLIGLGRCLTGAVVGGMLLATPATAQRELTEFGVDVFGVSWHYDSRTYWDGEETVRCQQTNPGLGLHMRLHQPSLARTCTNLNAA